MKPRKIPSAREMEQSLKVLYFRDDNDNRIAVSVQLMPPGFWHAWLEEGDEDGRIGEGETMMEAIVDLREQLAEEG